MIASKKVKIVLTLAIGAVAIAFSCMVMPSGAYAATTLNSGFTNMPAQNIVFDNLDVSKAVITSNSTAISLKTTSSYNGRKAVVWSITASGSKALTDPFSLKFTNAGFDSDGNRVDLVLNCTSCKAQLYSGKTAAARDQILILNELSANDANWKRYFQFTSLPDKGATALYGIQMTFDVRVYKTGTTTTTAYPLLVKANDFDWYDETTTSNSWSGTYAESITLNSGYGANSYLASNTLLGHNTANTRFYGTALDGATDKSAVVFTLNAAGGRITWAGSNCATLAFMTKYYEITASAGTGGSITNKGTVEAGWRTSKSYTVKPSTGYKISSVKVDGTAVAVSDASGFTYTFKEIKANHTIAATFTPISYNIAFNGNGATSGSVKSLTGCKGNTAYTLPQNGFKRPGYAFTGWNTKADGSGTKYSPGASVTNLSKTDGATVTLYAQWESTITDRIAVVRIPQDDYEKAGVALDGKHPFFRVDYADSGLNWHGIIDFSESRLANGFLTAQVTVQATPEASCDLASPLIFRVKSKTTSGTTTTFTLEYVASPQQESSDCIINHIPINEANAKSTPLRAAAAPSQVAKEPAESDEETETANESTNAPEQAESNREESEENNLPRIATLAPGSMVNAVIPDEAIAVEFGNEALEADASVDLSANQDGSIRGYYVAATKTFLICKAQPSLQMQANEDCSRMFEGKQNLKSIRLGELDMSNAKDLSRMFSGCRSLTSIDLSSWHTSNAANMSELLDGCDSISELLFGEGWSQQSAFPNMATFNIAMVCGSQTFEAGCVIPDGAGRYLAQAVSAESLEKADDSIDEAEESQKGESIQEEIPPQQNGETGEANDEEAQSKPGEQNPSIIGDQTDSHPNDARKDDSLSAFAISEEDREANNEN